jgi:transposase
LSKEQLSELLGGWEGYGLGSVGRVEGEVWIELLALPDRELLCGDCGRPAVDLHDVTERWIRDLPILGCRTRLLVQRCRVRCETCGPKLERLSWLDRYSRVSTRLAESVARLCAVLPIKHVAEYFELDWHTVKEIDKTALTRRLGAVDFTGVELLLLDEFAIQKGHRYATVAVDAARKRVLWVGRGRARADVRPLFELMGRERCSQIASYEREIRLHCPQAEIVYDLFHVVAKYGREVVDRVRVDEANRMRDDKRQRRLVKSSRWLLLRNRENVTKLEDQVRLDELLAANQQLMTVYVLKDDLKQLWNYRHAGYARRFWQGWYDRARASGIAALQRFAERLLPYLDGIIAHSRWPLHTSLLEGINNRIKVLKRMAYGYRDDAYFFLRIRAAFPGIPR